jgi:lycopene cyclase domain-containing protein
MWLYAIILLACIIVPALLSFDKKLQFYKQWKYLLPAISIVASIYIFFDSYLTRLGVWGFNPAYHLNFIIWGLPLEEWLFFIVVSYASVFLHDSIVLYFPQFKLPYKFSFFLGIFLAVSLAVLTVLHVNKAYTVFIFITALVALIFSFFDKTKLINHFYITYLIILIPFFATNAILTGTFIENEVVWYNNTENLGIRFFTIPIEDFVYGFSLILFVLLTREKLKSWYT